RELPPFERIDPGLDRDEIAEAAGKLELYRDIEQRHALRVVLREHRLPVEPDRAEQLVGRMVEPFEDARIIRHARRIAVRERDGVLVRRAVDFHEVSFALPPFTSPRPERPRLRARSGGIAGHERGGAAAPTASLARDPSTPRGEDAALRLG